MRFDPDFKPELCVSKDAMRTGITTAHLDVEGKRLLSTDGNTLSIIPCEVEPGDSSGAIPVDVIKAARKAKHPDGVVILCGKDLKIPPDGPTFPRPDVGAFPDVDRVVPRFKAGDPDTFEVVFNPSLLLAVAKSIGAGEEVRVVFGTKNFNGAWAGDPLLLSNGAKPGVIGVCMPFGTRADGGAPKGLGGEKAETPAELSRNAEKVADLEAEVKALRASLAELRDLEDKQDERVSKAEEGLEEAQGKLADLEAGREASDRVESALAALVEAEKGVGDVGRRRAARFAVRLAYSEAGALPPWGV